MVHKLTKEYPSWLFFGVSFRARQGKNPTEEEYQIMDSVLARLKEKAELFKLDISKIVNYDKNDSNRGYFPTEEYASKFRDEIRSKYGSLS